jgi:hypothetical protein
LIDILQWTHGRLAGDVARGKRIDHRLLEAALVVEDVMRDPDPGRDRAGVMDVLPGATGALAVRRLAMVVKLERDPDDVVTLRLEQRRRDRGIDAARHRDDHARVLRPSLQVERIQHLGPRLGRAPLYTVSDRRPVGHAGPLIIGLPAPDRIVGLVPPIEVPPAVAANSCCDILTNFGNGP